MEQLTNDYLDNLLKRAKESRIFTKDQGLCEEVWEYFLKRLPFSRIMRIIKTAGRERARQIFSEVKQSGCRDPLALFIWKTKRGKTGNL